MDNTYKPDPDSISDGEWARFIFVAGRLCIDFTQTGGETEQRAYWERFHEPYDLADWLSASPLHVNVVRFGLEDFQLALALREAIWRSAESIRQNKRPPLEDIDLINRIAAAPDLPSQLASDHLKKTWRSPATVLEALSLIGRDAVDLFSGELRTRIKQCENPNCGLVFVDTSRPGKRRWCLMKRCGTMNKNALRYGKD